MKSNYEERKQARIEAYKRLAEKNTGLSAALWKETQQMSNMMNGQPILIGHHSEKRHRRDIEKMNNKMSRSVEADKKADYYESRAAAAESNHAISSDDPDAIQKLKDKLTRLQETQELYKQINAICRKKIADAEKVVKLIALGMKESTAVNLLIPEYGRIGIPKYMLANNSGNMARIKERIEHLEKVAAIQSSETGFPNTQIKVVVSVEDNRVQVFFPGIPAEAVRKELKSYGFRWAPSVGAWMGFLNQYNIHRAQQLAAKLENEAVGMMAQNG